MKSQSLLLVSILLAGLSLITASASEIRFDIEGIKSEQGKLYIQLFEGEDNYSNGNALRAAIVAAKEGKVTVKFDGIAPGEYAIKFFHDENDNAQLETNIFGMPVEGFGFSNDAKPSFGPVNYRDAKFDISVEQVEVVNTATVIY
ncbi:DUF2141 domain-containing protein [Thalassotalea ganghwensis]